MTPIPINHFSDVLCIWAYIAQIRIDELRANFPGEVAFDYRYFSVFGDVKTKMVANWGDRGGLAGYAEHVREVSARFDHIELHPDAWTKNTPTSSMPAHLVLCAARLLDAPSHGGTVSGGFRALDLATRKAFFEQNIDISRVDELLKIAEASGIDPGEVGKLLFSGGAHAALASDMKAAGDLGVRASPTLTFNEGRQTLTGNVGYRVLEANVRELLNNPADELSWC